MYCHVKQICSSAMLSSKGEIKLGRQAQYKYYAWFKLIISTYLYYTKPEQMLKWKSHTNTPHYFPSIFNINIDQPLIMQSIIYYNTMQCKISE